MTPTTSVIALGGNPRSSFHVPPSSLRVYRPAHLERRSLPGGGAAAPAPIPKPVAARAAAATTSATPATATPSTATPATAATTSATPAPTTPSTPPSTPPPTIPTAYGLECLERYDIFRASLDQSESIFLKWDLIRLLDDLETRGSTVRCVCGVMCKTTGFRKHLSRSDSMHYCLRQVLDKRSRADEDEVTATGKRRRESEETEDAPAHEDLLVENERLRKRLKFYKGCVIRAAFKDAGSIGPANYDLFSRLACHVSFAPTTCSHAVLCKRYEREIAEQNEKVEAMEKELSGIRAEMVRVNRQNKETAFSKEGPFPDLLSTNLHLIGDKMKEYNRLHEKKEAEKKKCSEMRSKIDMCNRSCAIKCGRSG